MKTNIEVINIPTLLFRNGNTYDIPEDLYRRFLGATEEICKVVSKIQEYMEAQDDESELETGHDPLWELKTSDLYTNLKQS